MNECMYVCVSVSFDNSCEIELQNRMDRAWRAFYSNAHLLCCRKAPLKDRLLLLVSLVASCLLWCCSSWNATGKQISKIKGLQQAMLQKMIPVKRWEGESMDRFMQRFHSRIKRVKQANNFTEWQF